jgi:hypothetical protein
MLVLALAACGPPTVAGPGGPPYVSAELFPFDGERTSTFRSTDEALSYELVVVSTPPPDVEDALNVYTVRTSRRCVANDPECVDGELYTTRWASRVGDGVFVYGWDGVELDPPVRVANDRTGVGDVAETTTGGATWRSTMEGMFECPIAMSAEWDSCARFVVEADTDGGPLAGTWWATKGNGVAAFERDGEAGRWELSGIDCEGECNGVW